MNIFNYQPKMKTLFYKVLTGDKECEQDFKKFEEYSELDRQLQILIFEMYSEIKRLKIEQMALEARLKAHENYK